VSRDDKTTLLQCRGPERRLRPAQLVLVAAVLAVLAGGVALLAPHRAPDREPAAASLSQK
jgi:hypothetical protein